MHFPLSSCKPTHFFHGAFAPSFIWRIDAPVCHTEQLIRTWHTVALSGLGVTFRES